LPARRGALTALGWRAMRGVSRAHGATMEAIVTIFIFVIALFALNRYEFGRFD
jgi:hypothetical protein